MTTMTKGDTALAATAVAFCFSFPQKAGTGPSAPVARPSPGLRDQDLERLEKALLPSLAQNRYSTAFQNYLQALDQILSAPLPEKTTFTWELVPTYPTLVSPLGWAGRWRRSADPAAADAYRAAPAVRRGLRSPRQLSADPAAGHLFVQPYHPGQAANHTKWRQLPWRRLLHPPQQQRLQSRREPRKISM